MKSKIIIFVSILFGLVALDIVAKVIAFSFIGEYETIHAIPYLIDFVLVKNDGIAFSLFAGQQLGIIIFTSIMLVVACVICYLLCFKKGNTAKMFLVVSFAIFIAGGLGNLFDRIVYGYVRDFISFAFVDFAVFNLADVFLNVGVVCLIFAMLIKK